jgi:hypothetical protein
MEKTGEIRLMSLEMIKANNTFSVFWTVSKQQGVAMGLYAPNDCHKIENKEK